MAFSPDGKRLASGSDDRSIRLWDLESAEQIATLDGHSDWVRSVAFSPDGKRLASGSADRSIRLWNLDVLKYFELDADGKRPPSFEKIYDASFYLLGYRLEELKLVREPRPSHLTPVGGYRFPKARKYEKLERPRPAGKDFVEWILENVE